MTFPLNCWRYLARIEVLGPDRRDLSDCLEAEPLALWRFVDRETAAAQMRAGLWVVEGSFSEPYTAFAQDLAAISIYLFQVLRGLEWVERHVSAEVSDDVRAWKVLARQGEWVKLPLVVERDEQGRFHVDLDADDLEVIRARWADYPLWLHDGMRRKHPVLRDL